ncbi:MAG: GYF domain-containing protein [Bryobacteraceae bacterium]
MKYLIHRGGQQYGPYSVEELKQFVASGNVLPSDMAWAEGMPAWVPVSQILGGAPAQAPAPAPSYQAPSPAFAQPPSAAPASLSVPTPASGPVPPSLHWALVLVITIFCGIFGLIWLFVQAAFVRKLDPNNKSIMMFVVSFLVAIGGWIVMVAVGIGIGGTAAAMGSERLGMVLPVIFLTYLIVAVLSAVFGLLGVFGMRRSLLNYYNTVEPIGLQLSPVMTFFFALFYFQYHFTRIANWKRTGVLAA